MMVHQQALLAGVAAAAISANLGGGGSSAAKHARFNNLLGRGNRTSGITVTTTLTVSQGTINNLVDGGFGNNSTDSIEVSPGQSAKEIKFDFGIPKKITGFARYYSSSADSSSWKLTASADDTTYVDITNSVAPTGVVAKINSTGTNDGFYRYYKLVQTAGTTSNSPWYREVEFRIVDDGTADNVAEIAPAYANFLGNGDRQGYIIIAGTTSWSSGTLALINGSTADTSFFVFGQSGTYVEFDFGTDCLITELTWEQSNSTSHGTWKWQYFNGSTWVDVGSSFTLGGSTSQVITAMSAMTTFHSRYRLQQVSGTTSSSPFIREITFKIGYPEIT
jgi:hypothetical protein